MLASELGVVLGVKGMGKKSILKSICDVTSVDEFLLSSESLRKHVREK